ncbi:MAG: SIMPL domain-containing protein [Minicystis sp.]
MATISRPRPRSSCSGCTASMSNEEQREHDEHESQECRESPVRLQPLRIAVGRPHVLLVMHGVSGVPRPASARRERKRRVMSHRKYTEHAGKTSEDLAPLSLDLRDDEDDEPQQPPSPAYTRGIVAVANGEVTVRPDALRARLRVMAEAATIEEARRAENAAIAQVTDALRALPGLSVEVSAREITRRRTTGPSPVVSYTASQTLLVTTQHVEPDDVGAVASQIEDAALGAGAIVNSISLTLSDPSEALDEALADAIRNAQHDATKMADAARVRIVGIGSIEASAPPTDLFWGLLTMGPITVSRRVAVRFRIHEARRSRGRRARRRA